MRSADVPTSICSKRYKKTGYLVTKKMGVKTESIKDEAASHDDEVAPSDVAPVVDIGTFMKQPFYMFYR